MALRYSSTSGSNLCQVTDSPENCGLYQFLMENTGLVGLTGHLKFLSKYSAFPKIFYFYGCDYSKNAVFWDVTPYDSC
jgi:hypothetical protein